MAVLLLLAFVPVAAQSPSPHPSAPAAQAPSPTPLEHVPEAGPTPTAIPVTPLPASPEARPTEPAPPETSPSQTPQTPASAVPPITPIPTATPRPARLPTLAPEILPTATPRPTTSAPGSTGNSAADATPRRVPVEVDGVTILSVGGGGDLTAEERAALLRDRLEVVLTRVVDPPTVTVAMMGQNPVLQCEGIHIVTVTDADAAREAEPLAVAAIVWRDAVERGLRKVWSDRNGGGLARSLLFSILLVLGGAGLHALSGWFSRRYLRDPGWLLQGFLWLCVLTACLSLFPNTRGLGEFVHASVVTPLLRVLFTVGVGLAAWSGARAAINRYFQALMDIRSDPSLADRRGVQRVQTVHRAVCVFLDVVTAALMVAATLVVLHINPATLIASAGVIGVAVGVAAQDMLKDWTAGFAIIFEDQFGVGDVIVVGAQSGTVVSFTLRATQIRNMEGSLVTIPNSAMRVVENQSNQWSQIDLRISIDYATPDPRTALEIMEQAAQELYESVPELVLAAPEVLGVDQVTDTAIVLRMLLKTAPQMQYSVRRRLLEQIKLRFDRAGIRPPASRVNLCESLPDTSATLLRPPDAE